MKEYLFRITQNQLSALGGLLAAKAWDEVLLCTCGSGRAAFFQGVVRESWSFLESCGGVKENQVKQCTGDESTKYCVFSNDMEQLERVSYPSDTCLWGLIVGQDLRVFRYQNGLIPVDVTAVVDHTLHYKFGTPDSLHEERQLHERTIQAFGKGTTEYLANLTVGIAGASGTGSIVAEQLYRLGVKRIVLVDDDYVEERNLGRILNSRSTDAKNRVNKAEMLKRAYDQIGMGTEVIAVPTVIGTPDAIRLLSQCDLVFGCLDSADGRMHLNRLCTFYTVPYIDVGVKLKSEGGVISEISGAIRYIIPGEASMLSIGANTIEQVESEALRREDRDAYQARLEEKYIQGAQEGSPAVISVNMCIGSLAVLELLNRIHEYRDIENSEVEVLSVNLLEPAFPQPAVPAERDSSLSKYLGKGDCVPLLDMPGIGV